MSNRTPMTRAMSATLKFGQHRPRGFHGEHTRMKSTTPWVRLPWKSVSWRSRRSCMLPRAPPMMQPMAKKP
ncbi:hypothetical protein OV079_15220 [Nannocystis pusilla]|uniref:Uncharacterized protein n=1 Tax=Nannocystis pusilla TaxID=889268 RepID=A0A9X3IXE1_9BACT|nr:hypothetical protein [Nannocystis pusilla]MCY1006880.1 hypothetical protein [Nannocystis pusilla]